jgi:polar amino acid transport system permease protein
VSSSKAKRSWSQLSVRGAILLALIGVLALALGRLEYPWDWSTVWRAREQLAQGVWLTLVLSAGAMVVGFLLGTLGCLLRISRWDAPRFLGTCYVEIVRNTPLLVQLYVAYFCLASSIRYDNPPMVGVMALGVFAGAYITEILRAGVESIERGQTEAALSLGLTRLQALRHVIFPQAFRRVIPPLAGQLVSLIKDSSLLSTISITELTWRARTSAATNYTYFELYLAIAVLYLLLTFPLSRFSVWLERRLATGARA